jgi:hypothetical protein
MTRELTFEMMSLMSAVGRSSASAVTTGGARERPEASASRASTSCTDTEDICPQARRVVASRLR